MARFSIPRPALIRALSLVAILVGAFFVFRATNLSQYFDRELLAGQLEQVQQTWWAPLALIGLYTLVSPLGLPISPLVFAGGAAFGVKLGWIYNLVGSLLGATASFLLARALGHDFVAHLAGERRLRRIESLLEKHGFWAIVRSRFVVPFVLVNFGAALVGVRLPVFLTASVTGLAPSVLIYTYFGHALLTVATQDRQAVIRNLTLTVILLLVLSFLIPLRSRWKRRRYREDD